MEGLFCRLLETRLTPQGPPKASEEKPAMHLRRLLTLLAFGADASPALGQGGITSRSGPPSTQFDRLVADDVQAKATFLPPVPDVRLPTEACSGFAGKTSTRG